jgi:hypothetical protein
MTDDEKQVVVDHIRKRMRNLDALVECCISPVNKRVASFASKELEAVLILIQGV